MIFAPKCLRNTPSTKCKQGSFCSIFYKLSEFCTLEVTLWDKQPGLLVIQKTNILLIDFF
jgi:hypothetical protein